MVEIFIEMVGNIFVFTFFGAGVVFVESLKQISGSLTNVVAAAWAMNMIDHIWPM